MRIDTQYEGELLKKFPLDPLKTFEKGADLSAPQSVDKVCRLSRGRETPADSVFSLREAYMNTSRGENAERQ